MAAVLTPPPVEHKSPPVADAAAGAPPVETASTPSKAILGTILLRPDLLSKQRPLSGVPKGVTAVPTACRKYFVPATGAASSIAAVAAAAAAGAAGAPGDTGATSAQKEDDDTYYDDDGSVKSAAPTLLLRRVENEWTAYQADRGDTAHGLVNALLHSYNAHVPYHAYPHHLLMHLNMCVATHVSENSEKLRSTMVTHEGKETLTVKVRAPPGVPTVALWESMLAQFEGLIAERTKTPLTTHMNTRFTTSSSVSAAANRIATMAAMKNYFGYRFMLCCGVPSVVVHGEKKDWDTLRACYAAMKAILPSFSWWWSRMDRIVEAFCRMSDLCSGTHTADGKEEDLEGLRRFWSTVAASESYGSGSQEKLSGWISDLLPYSEDGRARWDVDSTDVPALPRDSVPSSVVQTPAEVNDHGDYIPLTLESGFLGMPSINAQPWKHPCP
jgi:hypothetical protein